MKTPLLRALFVTALTGSALGATITASPASAYYQEKNCAKASPGCQTDGSYVWRSMRTQKVANGNAPQLCVRAFSSGGTPWIADPCANNVIMLWRCYYGADLGFVIFSGSGPFAIAGRAANQNDQEGC